MTSALDGAVELLERALGYTRVVLADVTDHDLDHPTPCSAWDLADLLAHMEDALDAFTEAAGGVVRLAGPDGDPTRATTRTDLTTSRAATRVGVLQDKACALLGAWSSAAPVEVTVCGHDLDSSLLVATAALEVTVHGWDVGQATDHRRRIPEALARALLPVARDVVDPADRGVRFAAPRPSGAEAAYDARLLAFLGRNPAGT